MLLALGAASTLWDALQSLTSSSKASSVQTASQQNTSTPFEIDGGGASLLGSAASGTGASGGVQISPQTMSALIAAQSQSGASGTAPTDPSQALKDLFSQINVTGDGAITKQEFEQALGAGGTNIAAADDVFNKLDTNGDGTVSLDELKSALQGAGHHGHHHMHGAGSAGGADGTGSSSSDPLLAAIAGASETSVTNADGSTTTSITYADGSKVSLTTAAASSTLSASSSATSSYNLIEQLIQREAQALFASTGGSVSVHA
jgi:hypothetical protein